MFPWELVEWSDFDNHFNLLFMIYEKNCFVVCRLLLFVTCKNTDAVVISHPGLSAQQYPSHNPSGFVQREVFGSLCCRSVTIISMLMVMNVRKEFFTSQSQDWQKNIVLSFIWPGKWVVTPDYVSDSVKNGSWLAEGPYEISISTCATSAFYPVRQWREKVASGRIKGAFQGWRVLLMVQEPTRRAMFKRWGIIQKSSITTHSDPSLRIWNVAWF